MEDIIRGTDLKFNLHVEPLDGVSMEDYDFSVQAYCGQKRRSYTVDKADCYKEDADNYTVEIDTTPLDLGRLTIDVTVYLPDYKMPDSIRTEVLRFDTGLNIIQ